MIGTRVYVAAPKHATAHGAVVNRTTVYTKMRQCGIIECRGIQYVDYEFTNEPAVFVVLRSVTMNGNEFYECADVERFRHKVLAKLENLIAL